MDAQGSDCCSTNVSLSRRLARMTGCLSSRGASSMDSTSEGSTGRPACLRAHASTCECMHMRGAQCTHSRAQACVCACMQGHSKGGSVQFCTLLPWRRAAHACTEQKCCGEAHCEYVTQSLKCLLQEPRHYKIFVPS
eukprot:1158472-Pelagomonas_calceolata.AAC.4